MVFPSKKDLWMSMIIWISITLFFWGLYESTFVQFNLVQIIIMVLLIYLFGSFWLNTRYKIEEETLLILFGPFKKSVHIQDIKSIRNTKHLFSAPALSMHRIEINYARFETITISPKDKKAFIKELRLKNRQIQMKN